MAALFVSHSSSDQAATSRVCDRLRAEGVAALFVDFDPGQGIPAGRNWEKELYAQIRKADAMLFLSSPASVASRWCFAEIALARLLGKPVFPIVIEAGPHHPLLGDTQHIDLVTEGDGGFQRLWTSLRRAGLDPHASFAWDPTRSPYPGLAAFAEQDAAVFFGREPETERLLELLQPGLQGRGRFVAVVGPSGSGKSSLVRAGLLPRLAQLPNRWLVVPRLAPGSQPIRQLARSLAQAFKERGAAVSPAELVWRLVDGAPALVELIEELRDTSAGDPLSVLLVIDQAEELTTLSGPSERAALLDLLHGAIHNTMGVWVLATVRAEFLDPLLQQPGAADRLDEVVPVSPLDRGRLFAVIERPADRAGLQFAPGLVGRLVEDAQGGDALPLLAFTLRQLAEGAGPDGQISIQAYDASGGVVGALRAQAQRTADTLANIGHAHLIVPTLIRLATVTQEGEPTRRRVARNILTAAENQIIKAFIDARLLISREEQGEAVVEVAHEALLRQWPPLRQAIETRRDELRFRVELERWVQDWERAGRQDSYLISGERLEAAQQWVAAHPQELPQLPGASEFLAHSARQHLRTTQLRSEAIANRALAELDRDPELATLLAIAAVEEHGPSPRATQALSAALATAYPHPVLGGHRGAVRGVAFSRDGSRLATASADGTARVWDAASGTELNALRHEGEVWGVAFSPDGTRLASASSDRTARMWELASGAQLYVLGHQDAVRGVAFSPDGNRLATASADGTARVWDTASATQLHAFRHEGEVWGVAFSPDGTRLASASSDRTARMWELASGAQLYVLGHQDAAWGVAFSPDGNRLATASNDRFVRVWDAVAGTEVNAFGDEDAVWGVAFSSDGTRLATGSRDGTARVWDTASATQLHAFRHEGGVRSVAFSPDGSRLATGSNDGTARVWILAWRPKLQSLRGHQSTVRGVSFSPDGSRLATASADHTAWEWEVASGAKLQSFRHKGEVWGVAFSADGTRLATCGYDRTARIWELANGAQLYVLGHEDAVRGVAFSPDGNYLVTASYGTARVWDAASGIELHTLRHEDAVRGVAFSHDSIFLVTASYGWVRMWEVASGIELHTFRHKGEVRGVAFSSDGTRLATGSYEGTARVWEVASGIELHTLRHTRSVLGVAFSPDGRRLATASADGTARVWDAASGTELHTFRHESEVWGVAFSPDGTRLATASGDHMAWVWEVAPDVMLLKEARKRVTRQLSRDERRTAGLLS
jgi:WD40 repeat protein/energy-coupling factor transporter ATP-binding protein EcfA2